MSLVPARSVCVADCIVPRVQRVLFIDWPRRTCASPLAGRSLRAWHCSFRKTLIAWCASIGSPSQGAGNPLKTQDIIFEISRMCLVEISWCHAMALELFCRLIFRATGTT